MTTFRVTTYDDKRSLVFTADVPGFAFKFCAEYGADAAFGFAVCPLMAPAFASAAPQADVTWHEVKGQPSWFTEVWHLGGRGGVICEVEDEHGVWQVGDLIIPSGMFADADRAHHGQLLEETGRAAIAGVTSCVDRARAVGGAGGAAWAPSGTA